MAKLPQFQSNDTNLQLLQSAWASILDPVVGNAGNQALLLKDISLANGTTIINHKLGRKPQGWRLVDINGAAQIYRSEPLNNLTLTLVSNAAVTVSLEVF